MRPAGPAVRLGILTALALAAGPAAADHGGGLRLSGLSPIAAALLFAGLALLAGVLVMVVVALLIRRPAPDRAAGAGDE